MKIFSVRILLSELNYAIEEQKIRKSPGLDNIHKHLSTEVLNTLLTFYNFPWNSYVPATWRKSIIIPITKKDKPLYCPDSYR